MARKVKDKSRIPGVFVIKKTRAKGVRIMQIVEVAKLGGSILPRKISLQNQGIKSIFPYKLLKYKEK